MITTSSRSVEACLKLSKFPVLLGLLIPFFLPIKTASQPTAAKEDVSTSANPLAVVKTIADRVINQTSFNFKYSLLPKYKDAEIVDFGRNYGKTTPGFAYALSSVISGSDQEVSFETSHTGSLKIWINDKPVYEKTAGDKAAVVYREKTFSLSDSFRVRLQKGANKILLQSGTNGTGEWVVYLQSPHMKEPAASSKLIYFSLEKLAPDVKVGTWLIMGSLPSENGEVQTGFRPGQFYTVNGEVVTWTVPKQEIVADVVNNGEAYNWNYHVAGFMWAMQALSKETGDGRYAAFSNKWTSFILANKPLVEHQVKELHGVKTAFGTLVDRPMLDYTTAPTLPFISRLVYEKDFAGRKEVEEFVRPVIAYAKNTQLRLPDGTFAREEPEVPTVWVDDMFMGIPFLLFAAELTGNESEKSSLYTDAANQIISFNKHLFNPVTNLYHHTSTVQKPQNKYPHWSRANGWGLWATTEVLLRLPKQHPAYKRVMAIYKTHIDALVKLQNPQTGFWRNVLDKEESKDETSGTAIFTMALARGINNGWLRGAAYKSSALKGWKALQTVIEKDGTVHGTVVGTNTSLDVNFYYNRPVADNDTHGLFPLLFAGIEMNKMLKNVKL